MLVTGGGFRFFSPPPLVGCYKIGETLSFYVKKRPHWLARHLMRILLDWHWEDK